MAKSDGRYGKGCDIFSAGVVFYILLTGEPLFGSLDGKDILSLNRRCEIDLSRADPNLIDDDEKDLLKKMLCLDPSQRNNASECLDHVIFKGHSNSSRDYASSEDIIESEYDMA